MLKYFGIASVGVLILCGSNSAVRADLATSIVNGDFEASVQGGLYSNAPSDYAPWVGHGDYANATGVWFEAVPGSAVPGFPIYSGTKAGSMITVPDHALGQGVPGWGSIVAFTQSLGTVGAGDVGKEYALSADMGARGFTTHQYESTMSVGFTTNLATFALLGTPGILEIATPLAATPFGLDTRMGTFTPTLAEVGLEIFAIIHLESHTPFTVDEQQHFVDNASLAVVPEPAAWILIGSGALFLAGYRRMSGERRMKAFSKG